MSFCIRAWEDDRITKRQLTKYTIAADGGDFSQKEMVGGVQPMGEFDQARRSALGEGES